MDGTSKAFLVANTNVLCSHGQSQASALSTVSTLSTVGNWLLNADTLAQIPDLVTVVDWLPHTGQFA